jgi:hypothetical protein
MVVLCVYFSHKWTKKWRIVKGTKPNSGGRRQEMEEIVQQSLFPNKEEPLQPKLPKPIPHSSIQFPKDRTKQSLPENANN